MLAAAAVDPHGWLVAGAQTLTLLRPAAEVPGAGERTAADPAGLVVASRTPWHQVVEALWRPDARELHLRCHPAGAGDRIVRLAGGDTSLPEVVRERVMSTYVLSDRVAVRGRYGVTVAIRRDVVGGTLFVQTVPDEGVERLGPDVAARVHDLGAALAAQAGMRSPM